MPKSTDPKSIKTGGGRPKVTAPNYGIDGSGNLTHTADTDSAWGVQYGGVKSGTTAHVIEPQSSHNASTVKIDGHPGDQFITRSVEGAVDELSALMPPKFPALGKYTDYQTPMGIPDWGDFKLAEASLLYRSPITFTTESFYLTTNSPADIYPYWWVPPTPTQSYKPFEPNLSTEWPALHWNSGGNDPVTDPTFNVVDGVYSGGGPGKVFAGTYTSSDAIPVKESTLRIYYNAGVRACVVSGVVSPADRGVLALFHWPHGLDFAGFIAQAIQDKCVAALLLGQGIYGSSTSGSPRDGDPGGLFRKGTDGSGDYDPYVWPGQATGQAGFEELLTGVVKDGASPPNTFPVGSPYRTWDGKKKPLVPVGIVSVSVASPTNIEVTGHGYASGDIITIAGNTSTVGVGSAAINGDHVITWVDVDNFTVPVNVTVAVNDGTVIREVGCYTDNYTGTEQPFPGQVRLGTDPDAGVTVITGGIPIFGVYNGALGGGTDGNFFDYRLPYLNDYSTATGLKYTPEYYRNRYFLKPAVSLNPTVDLTQAGDYTNLPADYWPHQVARYRHRFTFTTSEEIGSWFLLHFKREQYFEEFIRDGVAPTDDRLYSRNIDTWSDIESLFNIYGDATPTPTWAEQESSSYHVLRANCWMDPATADDVPVFTAPGFTFTHAAGVVDDTMFVSGVQYFVPRRNLVAPGDPAILISDATVTADNLFGAGGNRNSYQSRHESSILAFLSTAPLCFTDQYTVTNPLYTEDDQKVLIPAPTAPPALADTFVLTTGAIVVQGDRLEASFTHDATLRAFFRRPLRQETVHLLNAPDGGQLLTPNPPAVKKILYHSTTDMSVNPKYGNWLSGGLALASTETWDKDVTEVFLDEIYRYSSTWNGYSTPVHLTGPGLAGAAAYIEVPVRAGRAPTIGVNFWDNCSWVQLSSHQSGVPILGVEAQVAGLPLRNPPLTDGAMTPFPAAGRLMFPKYNYTDAGAAYRPSTGDADITVDQPDYSVCLGDHEYVRAFDAAFSRSTDPLYPPVVNTQNFYIRIDGMTLNTFVFTGGGPGDNVAIMVKIPGITNWMDLGRASAAGPAYNDIALDGTGCQVAGNYTYDALDPETVVPYCQVEVDPQDASIHTSVGDPYVTGERCVLVKVILKDVAATKLIDFDHRIDSGVTDPDVSAMFLRGILGIRIVHPTVAVAAYTPLPDVI